MASLRRTSMVSRSSLETLASHKEQQESEPTEIEAFIPKELPPLPRLEVEIAYPPTSPKDHVACKLVSPNDAISGPTAIIVGGFVASVALAISHHFFLAFLHRRSIEEYPQSWVKNANNALSALFSLCITFVATSALLQMKWHAARSKPLSISAIDNLFAFPSPLALFTTVTSTRVRSLRPFLLPILAAIFIQSLSLVGVFAPNALTVAPGAGITRNLQAPNWNLSKSLITSIPMPDNGYTFAPQAWTMALNSTPGQPQPLNWTIPPGCGTTCVFKLVYEGPGLECRDHASGRAHHSGQDVSPLVYNATSTLYPTPRTSLSSLWEIEDQYEFRIGYITTDHDGLNTGDRGGSVHCMFRSMRYEAFFQVENNMMEVELSTRSYGRILGQVKYSESHSQCSQNVSQPCFINGANTRAMCTGFASALTGQIPFNLSEAGATETRGAENFALTEFLFSHASGEVTKDFHLAVPDLGESLVSLFSHLLLGSIPYQNDTMTLRAEIWDGSYRYTLQILWGVYFPTLLLASVVMLNGLIIIRSNKQGMDDKFSSFLLTTRSSELDVVCIDAADFEEFQRLRLLYQREKGTFSVVSIPSEGVAEKI